MSSLSVRLTTLTLIGLGTPIGYLVFLADCGRVCLVRPRLGRAMLATIQESILLPVCYALIALAVFVLAASPLMPLERMWNSLQRLPQVGPVTFEVTVPPGSDPEA